MTSNQQGARVRAPVPASAVDLLARGDAELVAATFSQEASTRFVHAHVAALRAGAALVQVSGRPVRRPPLRTVWDMVAAVAPELSGWAAYFADNAAARSAIEAGRPGVVDDERAELTLAAAEDFHAAVRARIGLDPVGAPGLSRAG